MPVSNGVQSVVFIFDRDLTYLISINNVFYINTTPEDFVAGTRQKHILAAWCHMYFLLVAFHMEMVLRSLNRILNKATKQNHQFDVTLRVKNALKINNSSRGHSPLTKSFFHWNFLAKHSFVVWR